jgi:geranylgeranyl pyrophosphate synthase
MKQLLKAVYQKLKNYERKKLGLLNIMNKKYSAEELCHRILENNGGFIANKARRILLEDPALKALQPPLEFISKNWRNPLTPALMSLSCEAVGGRRDETYDAALAMSLMSLSFYVWDDIVDKTTFKLFKPTLLGKFGNDISLIVGGLATAKAFSILNKFKASEAKKQAIAQLCWTLWARMAKAETVALRLRDNDNFSSKKKFWKIKTEAADLETCLSIGAIIGNGSEKEIQQLRMYGLCLGIVLELSKDFQVSVNLTAGLAQRLRIKAFPYSLLWASERSEKIRRKLDLPSETAVNQAYIKEIVEDALETRMLEHTVKMIKKFTTKATKELMALKRNNATRNLQLLIEAQPALFIQSLKPLQMCDNYSCGGHFWSGPTESNTDTTVAK